MKKQDIKIEKYKFAVMAADVAIFTLNEGELLVRLIDVNRPPYFVHVPGLPGGLLQANETADETARRLVSEKGKIDESKVTLEQLYTFSKVDRDPRGRVVAVAYIGLVPWESLNARERGNNKEVFWQKARGAKNLGYDHDEILAMAQKRLATRVTYTTLIANILPKEFTLTELEEAYEEITGKPIDKRNFRKKIRKLKLLVSTGNKKSGGRHRPAALYKFRSLKVKEIEIL